MARGPKKHLKRINTPDLGFFQRWEEFIQLDPAKVHTNLETAYLSPSSSGNIYTNSERDSISPLLLVRLPLLLWTKTEDSELMVKLEEMLDSQLVSWMSCQSLKTNEHYRMLYDVKGRFTLVPIKDTEAKFKLLKVKAKAVGPNKIPYIVTHDGRTIRFPHPEIDQGDTLKFDVEKQNKSQAGTRMSLENLFT
jgi:small subunit ribosomal protein S4e